MWRILWRHLFYKSGNQYGRQTGSTIDYNLHLYKSIKVKVNWKMLLFEQHLLNSIRFDHMESACVISRRDVIKE